MPNVQAPLALSEKLRKIRNLSLVNAVNYEDLIEKEEIQVTEHGRTVHVSLVSDPSKEYTLRIFTSSPNAAESSQKEYKITNELGSSSVPVASAFIETPMGVGLLFAKIEGVCLDQYIEDQSQFSTKVKIARILAETIEQIHKTNYIYQGLSPKNIFVASNDRVSLIDFSLSLPIGSSSHVSQSSMAQLDPEFISPEQTGRINRDIDYRCDFYSLGILLYYLFSGKKPFEGSRGELFHFHISQTPLPLHELDSDIPSVLSKLVERLMSKEPTERYQSSYGLIWDLKTIEEGLSRGDLSDFVLASRDIAQSFYVPQTLVGREKELRVLQNTFSNCVDGQPQLCVIKGASGVGKSRLVSELNYVLENNSAFFVEGKFDQFERSTPYSALRQALGRVVMQLESLDNDSYSSLKERLIRSVGINGQIITDLSPSFEKVIGKQPPLQELNPQESQIRRDKTLIRFLSSLASPDHPLVIFLDDVQWADFATLHTLDNIFSESNGLSLLVVVSYRSNEMTSDHKLFQLQKLLGDDQLAEVSLGNLSVSSLTNIISRTLHRDDISNLAEVIFHKANGNPFFTRELLKRLYDEGLIFFDSKMGRWNYDFDKIRSFEVSGNVVDLVRRRIRNLSEEAIEILKVASVLGHDFKFSHLVQLTKERIDQDRIYEILSKTVESQILIPLSDSFKSDSKSNDTVFKFLHDRIQQASYEMIDKSDLPTMHLNVARLFWKYRSLADIHIVQHFNKAIDLISRDEMKIVFHLNMAAARQAKDSGAYDSFLEFLKCAATSEEMLIEQGKEDALHDLYKNLMEANFYDKNVGDAEKNFDLAISYLKDDFKKAELLFLKATHFENILDLESSFDCCVKALRLLGVPMSSKLNPFKALWVLLKSIYNVYRLDKLDQIETDGDNAKKASLIQSILMSLGLKAYFLGNADYSVYCSLYGFNLNFKYGRSNELAYCMTAVTAAFTYVKLRGLSYEVARRIPDEIDKIDSLFLKSRAMYGYNVLVAHWYRPFMELEDDYRDLVHVSREAGDHLAESIAIYMGYFFIVQNSYPEGRKYIRDSADRMAKMLNEEYYQASLVVDVFNQIVCEKESYNELESDGLKKFEKALKTGTNLCFYYMSEMYLHYVYEDIEKAFVSLCKAMKYKKSVSSILTEAYLLSFGNLVLVEYLRNHPGDLKARFIHFQIRWTLKTWVNTDRFVLDRFRCLIEPTLAKTSFDLLKSLERFQGIAASQGMEARFQFHLMAFHLCKRFDLERTPYFHLNECVSSLEELGGQGLASYYRSKYKDQLGEYSRLVSSRSLNVRDENMDIQLIEKAQNALLQNHNIEKIARTSLSLMMEGVGANCGYYIEKNRHSADLWVKFSLEDGTWNEVDSVLEESSFSSDRGIQKAVETLQTHITIGQQDTSELVVPIKLFGQLKSIFVLRNTKVSNAFTKYHIRISNLLGGQIASSLSHASLLEDMEERVKEKAGDIRAILANIKQGILIFNTSDLAVTAERSRSIETILDQHSVVGKNAIDVLFENSDVSPQHRLSISKMIESREFDGSSLINRIKIFVNDEIRYLDLDWVPIFSHSEQFVRVLVTVRDISSVVRLQEIEKETVGAIQRSLLSRETRFGDTELSTYYKSAESVGGDWFGTYYHKSSERLFILVGDVTGHGVSSALVTGAVAGAANLAFQSEECDQMTCDDFLSSLASKLNGVVHKCGADGERLMTMVMVALDFKSGRLHYLNAGHNSVVLFTREKVELILEGGSPLGLPNGVYGRRELSLSKGDLLFLYTDGLVDQKGPDGRSLSLKKILKEVNRDQDVDYIRNMIRSSGENIWQNQEMADDCTFLVLKVGSNGDKELESLDGVS